MAATNTAWKFYLSPEQTWEGMYQACERARYSIDFEQYIFVDDFLGRRFIELLSEKARHGVRVRLLCDMVGSYSLYRSAALAQLRQSGVHVQFFNPIKPWWIHELFDWFLRTHRKLLVVDGEYGFIGGVGIHATMRNRRDTHVRLRGPVVDEMASAFETLWKMNEGHHRFIRFARPLTDSSDFTLLTNSPRFRQRFTYWALVRRFRAAKKTIYITTPYFVPDGRVFRALKGAARRGVDVRILLPANPDWRLAYRANRSFYGRALKAGVRFFEYGPDFIHSKTTVVDGAWACIGSSNIDSLSLLFNYEADVASSDKEFVAELTWHFIEDSKSAREIPRATWRLRPVWEKVIEQLVRPLHRFM